MILDGEVRSGQRLNEIGLAAQLGVSRGAASGDALKTRDRKYANGNTVGRDPKRPGGG